MVVEVLMEVAGVSTTEVDNGKLVAIGAVVVTAGNLKSTWGERTTGRCYTPVPCMHWSTPPQQVVVVGQQLALSESA